MSADVKIFTDMVEESAVEQINHVASLPAFAEAKIRIMPDVHAGKGCVCGFTADLGDKVVPNLVGVDIGCGCLATDVGGIEIDFAKLDRVIKRQIPSGMKVNGRDVVGDRRDYVACSCDPKDCQAAFTEKELKYFDQSLMSLGCGNHFLSIEKSEKTGHCWLIVHCGSRNFGKKVCEWWQDIALQNLTANACGMSKAEALKKAIEEKKAAGKTSEIQDAVKAINDKYDAEEKLLDRDLAWLEGASRDGYIHDMKIAQRWAALNRKKIAEHICRAMDWTAVDQFDTVHNYLGDDNIIRKSAIAAYAGQKVLIPMNMRDGSVIAVGKGNEDWNFSAPHGAGRLMSRAKARASLSADDFKKTMEGIYTTTADEDTLDEAPEAYKPMEKIIEQVTDTVDIAEVLKPVYNFKAAETPCWKTKKKSNSVLSI